jgi:hypothetical protein
MKLIIQIQSHIPQSLLSGIIYWKVEAIEYPDKIWIDNVNVLIGWWLTALDRLADQGGSETFKFMEGPFELFLRPIQAGLYEITSSDGRVSERCEIRDIVAEVLRACREMIQWYFDKDGNSVVGSQYERAANAVARKWQREA